MGRGKVHSPIVSHLWGTDVSHRFKQPENQGQGKQVCSGGSLAQSLFEEGVLVKLVITGIGGTLIFPSFGAVSFILPSTYILSFLEPQVIAKRLQIGWLGTKTQKHNGGWEAQLSSCLPLTPK
jgi:hypothetical protein